jgi:DNA-binding MarR family transcriptional regulator
MGKRGQQAAVSASAKSTASSLASDTGRGQAHPELRKTDYETLAAFRYQLRCFLEFSQSAAHEAGLTPQQHQALLAIIGRPGRETATIGELAECLLIQHHSAVELTNRLSALGLVQRQHDEDDRRKVRLSLTLSAKDILSRMSSAHLEDLRRIGPQLSQLLQRFAS